jgi:riboflavin biosynthesis pyrimidine reductase
VSALLSRGLVDQLSLIIVPTVTGRSGRRLFDAVEAPVGLQLVQRREEQGCQVLLFDVRGRAEPSLAE